jgi:hypothetical protein
MDRTGDHHAKQISQTQKTNTACFLSYAEYIYRRRAVWEESVAGRKGKERVMGDKYD